MDILRKINLDEVRDFIDSTSQQTKIYLGADSERFKIEKVWHADYTVAIVIHIDSSKGCKVFGQVSRERDYDAKAGKPALRMMNEVYLVADMYARIADIVGDREVEVHLDINPDIKHGSSCAINQAVGYIRGVCNVIPMVKPNAFAASFAADRLKEVLDSEQSTA